MKIQPTNDMVLLRPASSAEKTKGGIIIPDTDKQEKCVRGEVLAVGPGRLNERYVGTEEGRAHRNIDDISRLPMNCKPGDVVLFERGIGGGYEISLDGEKLYMTRDACVVAYVLPE